MKMKQKNITEKTKKQSKGITLIALVITIIVLLILAGVTIATLTGDNGLLQKTTNAKQANEEASALEKIKVEVAGSYGLDGKIDVAQLNKNLYRINELTYNNKAIKLEGNDKNIIEKLPATVMLNGYVYKIYENGSVDKMSEWIDIGNGNLRNTETGQTISVGDTVKYETILQLENNNVDNEKKTQLLNDLKQYSGAGNTDNTNIERDNLQWKVLDVKDGKIRLISEKPTTSKVKFDGVNGYNNIVYLLDETCDIFYSTNIGKAQNLKIEDIEKQIDKSKLDYTQYIYGNVKYGDVIEANKDNQPSESPSHLKYPNIYANEIGCKAISNEDNVGKLGLSEQTELIKGESLADNKLIVTQTLWSYNVSSETFVNSKYYELFIDNGTKLPQYWLSSRTAFVQNSNGDTAFHGRVVNGTKNIDSNLLYIFYWGGSANLAFRPVITLDSDIEFQSSGINTWQIK